MQLQQLLKNHSMSARRPPAVVTKTEGPSCSALLLPLRSVYTFLIRGPYIGRALRGEPRAWRRRGHECQCLWLDGFTLSMHQLHDRLIQSLPHFMAFIGARDVADLYFNAIA